jgi:hypothetical protein
MEGGELVAGGSGWMRPRCLEMTLQVTRSRTLSLIQASASEVGPNGRRGSHSRASSCPHCLFSGRYRSLWSLMPHRIYSRPTGTIPDRSARKFARRDKLRSSTIRTAQILVVERKDESRRQNGDLVVWGQLAWKAQTMYMPDHSHQWRLDAQTRHLHPPGRHCQLHK